MNKKYKIAIFSGVIPTTTFIENLIDGMTDHFIVQLYGIKERSYTKNKNIKVYATPKNKSVNLIFTIYRSILLLLKCPKDLIKLLKVISKYNSLYEKWVWFSKFLPIILYRPDVFHMQWARDIEFYMFLKTEFSIPIIISLRGAHINYTPIIKPRIAEIYREHFPQVDAFHAVSKAISKEAQKYGAQLSSIEVIHSPVNKNISKRFLEERYKNPKGETLKLVSVGRFHWIKGYTYAFRAIKLLKNKGYKVEYTIVSTTPLPEELIFQIEQDNLENSINILKGMPHDETLSFIQGFDLMLLPSLKEGIANVVLEAMAMGVLVVSTDCGGMPEVVKNRKTGWLVPVRDPEAIALAVEEFLKTEGEKLNQMAIEAHNLIKKEFEAEDAIAKFEKMYRSMDQNEKRV